MIKLYSKKIQNYNLDIQVIIMKNKLCSKKYPVGLFHLGLSFSLVTGLYACSNGQNSGINLKNLNIGANVTQIQKITQQNKDTTVYIRNRSGGRKEIGKNSAQNLIN